MSSYADRFGGIGRLYGAAGLDALRRAHVAVVGVGGVGSWAVEALARSGVGALTLVDLDEVCLTNTNRQLPALDGAIGRAKVDVLAERVAAINPECRVRPLLEFYGEDNFAELLEPAYDYVIDAIDALPAKVSLVRRCVERGVPIVVSGGAGGRRDPTAVSTADLSETSGDALLRRLRRILRQDHGFAAGGRWGIPAVYSAEKQWFPAADGEVCEQPDGSSLRMDCASGFGAATFVTGAFGFAAAGIVVRELATRAVLPPIRSDL